jgi:hypothetical protein
MGRILRTETEAIAWCAEKAQRALTAAAYPDHCHTESQIEMLITALHHYANSIGVTAEGWADMLEEAQGMYHADGGNDDGYFVRQEAI